MTKHTRKAEFLALLDSPPSECWLWPHADNGYGYGRIRWGDNSDIWLGHRLAYTMLVGPIPDGMVLDHRCHTDDPECVEWDGCRHRACVNPSHLEVVTSAANHSRQKKHGPDRQELCRRGHPLSGENLYTYTNRSGQVFRICKTCRRDRKRRYRQERTGR